MSDPYLLLIKDLIIQKDKNNDRLQKVNKKDMCNIKKKLLKHVNNLRIIKDLLYLMDHDTFDNQTKRYVIPNN